MFQLHVCAVERPMKEVSWLR